jgi:alcohol dehydrogenase class IV
MWYFRSPVIVYGEDALSHLAQIQGRRAFIVTDSNMVRLGHVDRVRKALEEAGFEVAVFDQVEPDPSLETAQAGAQAMAAFEPDWVVGLGGGSPIDAARAMWILYERPDVAPEAINPLEPYGLRQKARMIAIPTTSGTGAESTWATVLTHKAERRKIGTGHPEAVADYAVVDPVFVTRLPPQITADTGMDALTHAVEGFTSTWHQDFTDGLCLKAAQLVFQYLPRAYRDGNDLEAREKMHNAASMGGLGYINSWASLAHGMGHSLGGVFHVPHGRAVSLFLPYTIEYFVRGGGTRYAELAYFLRLPSETEEQAATSLAQAIRDLQDTLSQPRSVAACGISRQDFDQELPLLVNNALNDNQTLSSPRFPSEEDLARLYEYAYDGRAVDF